MTLIEAPPTVTFRLNGEDVSVRADHPHLLAALREELGVTSPKDGCAPSGQCGCCTVLVGSRAVVSCQVPLTRVKGREVTTVEGLDPVERDRMARGFAATGALQCGFCTPGIVIRTKALIDQKGSALNRRTINGRLGAHLCRCTGYTKIVEAIELLASGEPIPTVARPGGVGKDGAKYEALELTLGDRPLHRRPYVADDAACRRAPHRPLPGGRVGDRHLPGRGLSGSGESDHSRRRSRRSPGRPDPQGLAGVHPGGRPYLIFGRTSWPWWWRPTCRPPAKPPG